MHQNYPLALKLKMIPRLDIQIMMMNHVFFFFLGGGGGEVAASSNSKEVLNFQ